MMDLVVNELQLSRPIAATLSGTSSADFAWLLSLLSEDVLDRAEFSDLPEPKSEQDEQRLRRELAADEPVRLYAAQRDWQEALSQTQLLADGQWDNIRLLTAAHGQPLIERQQQANIPEQLLSLLPPNKQMRYANTEKDAPAVPKIGDLNIMARTDVLLDELRQLADPL